MASGFGLNGGVSRCYPFWQDFLACYVTQVTEKDERWRCVPQRDDYVECLHHGKEAAKVSEIRAAYIRRLKDDHGAMPEGGRAGDVKSVGVLGK